MKIDPEFKDLIEPMTGAERTGLEESLKKDGLLSPLVIWKEQGIILDGHNRYEICTRLDIPVEGIEISIESREHAWNWIIKNQLSRRNLTPDQMTYLMGRRYSVEKGLKGGNGNNQYSKEQSLQNEDFAPGKTNAVLAKEYGVNKSTIERAEKYAQAVDAVSAVTDDPTGRKSKVSLWHLCFSAYNFQIPT